MTSEEVKKYNEAMDERIQKTIGYLHDKATAMKIDMPSTAAMPQEDGSVIGKLYNSSGTIIVISVDTKGDIRDITNVYNTNQGV